MRDLNFNRMDTMRLKGLPKLEQLKLFVDWEKKNYPKETHIAEWALAEIERLTAQSSAPSAEPVARVTTERAAGLYKPQPFGVELYAAPPHLSAAVAAAIEQAARVCKEMRLVFRGFSVTQEKAYVRGLEDAEMRIRALQTEDGLAALRELIAKGVEAGYSAGRYFMVEMEEGQSAEMADRVLKGE